MDINPGVPQGANVRSRRNYNNDHCIDSRGPYAGGLCDMGLAGQSAGLSSASGQYELGVENFPHARSVIHHMT